MSVPTPNTFATLRLCVQRFERAMDDLKEAERRSDRDAIDCQSGLAERYLESMTEGLMRLENAGVLAYLELLLVEHPMPDAVQPDPERLGWLTELGVSAGLSWQDARAAAQHMVRAELRHG